MQDLGNERIHSGDVLLVQGTWSNIARLSKEDSDWVVLGQPLAEAAKVTLDYKAPVAAAIMVLMVAMMVFDFIPVAPVTAVMIAGILMVLTGCFRNVEAALQNNQLGKYCIDCGYASYVFGIRENRRFGVHLQYFGKWAWILRTDSIDGWYLFYDIIDDYVYQ